LLRLCLRLYDKFGHLLSLLAALYGAISVSRCGENYRVGGVGGEPLLDLCAEEDVRADMGMNA
jgi:hypothetical protein